MSPRALRVLLASVVVAALSACHSGGPGPGPLPQPSPRGAIRIGAFDFSESRVLAEIYATALRDNGYAVARTLSVAPREVLEPALEQGRVDLVPEYMGTALDFVTLGRDQPSPDPRRTHELLVRALRKKGIAALSYAPAQDRNGFVVTDATARRLHLDDIGDLRKVATRLDFGGPPECPDRPLCLPGLKRTYGLVFRHFQPLDSGGPLTLSTLVAGEVDVALLFTTDPNIETKHLRLLRDNRRLQPAENVVPVMRRNVLRRHGEGVAALLDSVTARLSTGGLRALNEQVSFYGADPAAVASSWLRQQGLEG